MRLLAGREDAAVREVTRKIPLRRQEWLATFALCAALLALNAGLPFGQPAQGFTYNSVAVLAGQWWRLLTHPFVHVSLYHALLDGAAFLLLWVSLRDSLPRRFAIVACCAAGAWLVARLSDPTVTTHGLCGLSGVAHGLMSWQALSETRAAAGRRSRFVWLGILAGVVGKCAWEVATGGVLLSNWHLGDVGSPVPGTHAGGVLAALTAGLATGIGRMRALKRRA
jgi:rhomboid family GlyGly-CTERM serine protease